MARASRRKSASTSKRFVEAHRRFFTNLSKRGRERVRGIRRRIRRRHNEIEDRQVMRVRRTIEWWRWLYNLIRRLVGRLIPSQTRFRWTSRQEVQEVLDKYVLGHNQLPYYLSMPKHMYCRSKKGILYWEPGVSDVLQGYGYVADAVDLTVDDILTPPPSNDELQDLQLMTMTYIKEDEIFTITEDAGEVQDSNSTITVVREGREKNILYRLPAYLYHYLEKLYTRLRAWILGRTELQDGIEPCSIYIYPGNRKPRRSRNTKHRRVKVDRHGGHRIWIRDYRKRWVPGVPPDE